MFIVSIVWTLATNNANLLVLKIVGLCERFFFGGYSYFNSCKLFDQALTQEIYTVGLRKSHYNKKKLSYCIVLADRLFGSFCPSVGPKAFFCHLQHWIFFIFWAIFFIIFWWIFVTEDKILTFQLVLPVYLD